MNGVEGLADRLIQRWMGVYRFDHGFHGGFGLHGGHRFSNQLIGVRTKDMDTQNLAVLAVRHHLHKAIGLAENLGLAVGDEGELAHLDIIAAALGVGFGEAHTANAGFPAMWPSATTASMVPAWASCG